MSEDEKMHWREVEAQQFRVDLLQHHNEKFLENYLEARALKNKELDDV